MRKESRRLWRAIPWGTIAAVLVALGLAALPFLAKYREFASGFSPAARHMAGHLGLRSEAPSIGGFLSFFCPLCGRDVKVPIISTAAVSKAVGTLRLEAEAMDPAVLLTTSAARRAEGPQ